jgi:hypothetical protein
MTLQRWRQESSSGGRQVNVANEANFVDEWLGTGEGTREAARFGGGAYQKHGEGDL